MFYKLFKSLEILHEKEHIVHGDIKPLNLMFDENCENIYLIDFSFANQIRSPLREYTEEYYPPGYPFKEIALFP